MIDLFYSIYFVDILLPSISFSLIKPGSMNRSIINSIDFCDQRSIIVKKFRWQMKHSMNDDLNSKRF